MEVSSSGHEASEADHFRGQVAVNGPTTVLGSQQHQAKCNQLEQPPTDRVGDTGVAMAAIAPVNVAQDQNGQSCDSTVGTLSAEIAKPTSALLEPLARNRGLEPSTLGVVRPVTESMMTSSAVHDILENPTGGSTDAVPYSISRLVCALSNDLSRASDAARRLQDDAVAMETTQVSADIPDLASLDFGDDPELVPGHTGVDIMDTDHILKTVALSSGENSMFSANNSDTENPSVSNETDISKLLSQVDNSIAMDTTVVNDDEDTPASEKESASTCSASAEHSTATTPVMETMTTVACHDAIDAELTKSPNEEDNTNCSAAKDCETPTLLEAQPSKQVSMETSEDIPTDTLTQQESAKNVVPDSAQTESAPEGDTSITAPEGDTSITAPEIAHSLAAPEIAHSLAAPEIAHSFAAPEIAQTSAPEIAHSHAAPEIAQTEAAPEIAHSLAAPEIAQTESAPEIAHSLAAPEIAQTESAPEIAHSLAAPEIAHSLAAPEITHSLAAPEIAQTESAPEIAHSLAAPEIAHSLAAPEITHSLAAPEIAQTESAPEIAHSLAAPEIAQTESALEIAHSLAAPEIAHSLAAPEIAHSLAAPEIAQTESAPEIAHSLAAPEITHSLTAPEIAHSLAAPEIAHSLAAPEITHSLTAPEIAYSLAAPEIAHSLAAPEIAHSLAAPEITHSLAAPEIAHSLAAPEIAHSLAAPEITHSLTAPEIAHSLAAPEIAHSLAAPEIAHSLAAPEIAHSLAAPEIAHSLAVPDSVDHLNQTLDSEDNHLGIDESAEDSDSRRAMTDGSRETIEWNVETAVDPVVPEAGGQSDDSEPPSPDGNSSTSSQLVILDEDVDARKSDSGTTTHQQGSITIEPIVITPDSPEPVGSSESSDVPIDQQSVSLLQEMLTSSNSKASMSANQAPVIIKTSSSVATPVPVGLFLNRSASSEKTPQPRRRASLESRDKTTPAQSTSRQRSASGDDAAGNQGNSAGNLPMIMEVFGGVSDKKLVDLHSKGSIDTPAAAQKAEIHSAPAKLLTDLGKSAQDPIVLDDYVEQPIDLDNVVIKDEKVDAEFGKSSSNSNTKTSAGPPNIVLSSYNQGNPPTVVYSIVGQTLVQTTTNSALTSARNQLRQSLTNTTVQRYPQTVTYQTQTPGGMVRHQINSSVLHRPTTPLNPVIIRPDMSLQRQAIASSQGMRSIILSTGTQNGPAQLSMPVVHTGKQGAAHSQGSMRNVTLVLTAPSYTPVTSAPKRPPDSNLKVLTTIATSSSSSNSTVIKVVTASSTASTVSSTSAKGNKVISSTSSGMSVTTKPSLDLEKLASIVKKHKDTFDVTSMVYEVKSPPPELLLDDTPKCSKFYCRGCNSHFLLKSTLSQHQLRRTMCIKYECSLEKACRVLFYNPCQLNLHLRLHKPTPNWKSKIDIKGLPEDMVENPSRYLAFRDVVYRGYRKLKYVPQKKVAVEEKSAPKTDSRPVETQPQKSVSISATVAEENESSPSKHAVSEPALEKQLSGSILANAAKAPVDSSPSPTQVPPHRPVIKVLGKSPSVVNTSADTDPVICVECGMSFTSKNTLAAHMNNRSSNKKLYFCKTCPVVLRSKCSQQAHSRIHKNIEPYVCPECGQVVHGSHKVFWKHLHVKCAHHIRQATFNCPNCQTLCNTRKALAKHIIDTHIDNFYKCLQCPMAFRSEDSLKSHARQEHAGVIEFRRISKCGMCDAVYNEGNLLIEHLITAHIEINTKLINVVNRCNACNVIFTPRISCISHMEKEHKFYFNHNQMCHFCGVEIKASPTLFFHLKTKHPELGRLDAELTEQLRKKGIVSGGPVAVLQLCVIPGGETMHQSPNKPSNQAEIAATSTASPAKSTTTVSQAKTQTKANESVLKIKEEPGMEPEKKEVYSCSRCQTDFDDAEVYQRHMAKHRFVEKKRIRTKSDDLVLKIKIPKLSESDSSSGSVKLKTEATPSAPKVFTRQVPDAPEPEPQFSCSECTEGFHLESELNSHLREVHSTTRQFPCHLCGMTYNSAGALKTHFFKEHEGTKKDRPFVCYVCQEQDVRKSYATRPQLIKHLISVVHKIPRNMIDYTRFPDAGSVRPGPGKGKNKVPVSEAGSVETHDNRSDTSSTVGDPLEAPPVKRLKLHGETNYSCAKCTFTSESREEFVEHIKKHQNSKTQDLNQCKECGLTFAVLPTLRKHLFVVHKIRNFTKYLEDTGIDLISQPKEEDVVMPKRTANPPPNKIRRINGIKQPKTTPSPVEKAKSELDVNECTVCYKLYGSEYELRTHMRTHGMAFIRSKRLDLS